MHAPAQHGDRGTEPIPGGGSTRTRDSALVTSCIGPITRSSRRCRCRMPRLLSRPQRGSSPASAAFLIEVGRGEGELVGQDAAADPRRAGCRAGSRRWRSTGPARAGRRPGRRTPRTRRRTGGPAGAVRPGRGVTQARPARARERCSAAAVPIRPHRPATTILAARAHLPTATARGPIARPASSTPTARPAASVRIRSARVCRAIEQRPVAKARVSIVFWLPFLASTGQAKPTQSRQRAHPARPR